MRALIRTSAFALAALAMVAAPLESQAGPGGRGGGHSHGHRGHGGWGHGGGHYWGGFGWGLGLRDRHLLRAGAVVPAGYVYQPGYVVAVPPPAYDVGIAPAPPAARAAPDPIIYPNRGQSAGQTEADRQACDRWAMTQPSAMADASVFHRATLACMEGRGYTVK